MTQRTAAIALTAGRAPAQTAHAAKLTRLEMAARRARRMGRPERQAKLEAALAAHIAAK